MGWVDKGKSAFRFVHLHLGSKFWWCENNVFKRKLQSIEVKNAKKNAKKAQNMQMDGWEQIEP